MYHFINKYLVAAGVAIQDCIGSLITIEQNCSGDLINTSKAELHKNVVTGHRCIYRRSAVLAHLIREKLI